VGVVIEYGKACEALRKYLGAIKAETGKYKPVTEFLDIAPKELKVTEPVSASTATISQLDNAQNSDEYSPAGWLAEAEGKTTLTMGGLHMAERSSDTAMFGNTYNGLIVNDNFKTDEINASKPCKPHYKNTDGYRSPKAYDEIIDQFEVATNPRYKKREVITKDKKKKTVTYCNIFAWDVMAAMNVVLPQKLNNKTNKPEAEPSYENHELLANAMADWLRNDGIKNYGWRKVTAEEAQAAANRGEPTIVYGRGHMQVVRPAHSGDKGVYVAGGSNYDYGTSSRGFGGDITGVEYFTHK
jgi:hypothetical protein